MKRVRTTLALLLGALLLLSGCARREPVRALTCVQPDTLPGLCAAGGANVAVCRTDYEAQRTTVQLVDTAGDTVRGARTLDGAWELPGQTFSGGGFALRCRANGTWLLLDADLADAGTLEAEDMDGFFSRDAGTYYYLSDHMLCSRDVATGVSGRVPLAQELRLAQLTAFDGRSGRLAAQFYLSPYGSECGTAIIDTATGALVMLRAGCEQTVFTGGGLCLLSFDAETMGYGVCCGSADGGFYTAGADAFSGGGELYAIAGTPYLMRAGADSTLYAAGAQIRACALTDLGVTGELHTVCALPDKGLLVGAAYAGGVCRLYVIDPARLPMTKCADAARADSPLTVDTALVQAYRSAADGVPVAETLQAARQYADSLETKYGVRILLSAQCRDAAARCDRAITCTDTMAADEELRSIRTALGCLSRSLALYPEGFPAQFRSGAGEGGLRFLLVGPIESDYGVVGCTYETGGWQNIALDVRMAEQLDGLICHEIWHATENRILSHDYAAFLPDAWAACNPEGFRYSEDAAAAVPDAQRWTLSGGSLADVYFVDSYGRVNAQEDRARIMEYFMAHDDEAQVLIGAPAIREKLAWMCRAVRGCFDTTGWDSVRWERLL